MRLTSAVSGAIPFAYGQPLADGELNSTVNMTAEDTDSFQARATAFYPSGNPKHVIVSGIKSLTAGSAGTVTMVNGAPVQGTDVSLANLRGILTSGSVNGTSLAAIIANAPHETIVSGPVMSQWHFRHVIDQAKAVVFWMQVRCWASGHVDIFPWIENGHVAMAATNDVRQWNLVINGRSVFGKSIDLKAFNVIYLMNGRYQPYSYDGTEFDVVCSHDMAQTGTTGLLMNFSSEWAPPANRLNGFHQAYNLNEKIQSAPAAMGQAGGNAAPINPITASYIASGGDTRAYRGLWIEAMHAGGWETHRRSPNTHFPFAFDEDPNVKGKAFSGGQHAPTGSAHKPKPTHEPEFGYSAWLLTGISAFRDECLHWAGWNFLKSDSNNRLGAKGICWPVTGALTVRGAIWALRTHCQALSMLHSSHPSYNGLKYCVEQNFIVLRDVFVAGDSAILDSVPYHSSNENWVSPMGAFGVYVRYGVSGKEPSHPFAFNGPGFQQAMWPGAMGHAWRLGLPLSNDAIAAQKECRDHSYKFCVGILGGADSSPSGWNWRRCAVYALPVGDTATATSKQIIHWYTWAEAARVHEGQTGSSWPATPLGNLPNTEGLSILRHTSNTDEAGGYWGSYLGLTYGGICHAVQDGFPGAADCYRRITGASNFRSTADGNLPTRQEWAIRPLV